MKHSVKISQKMLVVATLFVFLLASMTPVFAHSKEKSVELEGDVICAKCTLKEDIEECQNVLVVKAEGKEVNYYFKANEVNEEYGSVCTARKHVKVTGTVSHEDGKMWIAATKISPVEES